MTLQMKPWGKSPEFNLGTIGKVSSLLLRDLTRMRTVYLSVPRSLRHASAFFRKSFIPVSLTAPVVCRLSLPFKSYSSRTRRIREHSD